MQCMLVMSILPPSLKLSRGPTAFPQQYSSLSQLHVIFLFFLNNSLSFKRNFCVPMGEGRATQAWVTTSCYSLL